MSFCLADLELGKSRYYFKPNILSANGTIIVTDPKAELLRDCGYSLKKKGYTIKVLNLDEKSHSNHYNPFIYVKEAQNFNDILGYDGSKNPIQEDDVMSLINTLMVNTKSENIENTSRRSFLGESRDDFLTITFLLHNSTL